MTTAPACAASQGEKTGQADAGRRSNPKMRRQAMPGLERPLPSEREPYPEREPRPCPRCNTRGWVEERKPEGTVEQKTCPVCKGDGYIRPRP